MTLGELIKICEEFDIDEGTDIRVGVGGKTYATKDGLFLVNDIIIEVED